ncbi:MAG: carboxypeptidase-like regulatory domain-containing protein [Candidatus Micrarchaeota archaeon]|nr:carboxypeptidase-like regulatory domain-containing protein [Candidatus Micrarchaeota archaeon]
MRSRLFAALFLLLAASLPQAHAYILNVKVTVTQDTAAVGTNISIMSNGVEIAMIKANSSGEARFNVTSGSYFVLLRRYPYPLHVALVEVREDSSVLLTMSQSISHSTVFGQISGPPNFYNVSVAAYKGGLVQRRASANKDGLYTLSFLPEGDYDIVFFAPGFQNKSLKANLLAAEPLQLDVALEPQKEAPPQPPILSSPAQASLKSLIEVLLTQGGAPVASATVVASTPSGRVELVTDSQGRARLNAAEGGEYIFTYLNASSKTIVPLPTAQPKQEEGKKPDFAEPQQQPPAQLPQEQRGAPQDNLQLGILWIAGGALLVSLLVAAAAILLRRGGGAKKRKKKHKS